MLRACPKITSPTKGPLEPRGGPGHRGWFARVVQEGEIQVGDFAEAPDVPPAKKQRHVADTSFALCPVSKRR